MAIKWKSKTSWRQKLEKPQEARAVQVPPRMQKTWGKGRMLIATPLLVDELVKRIPKGKLATVAQLMGRLAREYHCDTACPMTTGIFAWIAAHAAEEARAAGEKDITPWWRTLKSGGELNPKYPGGIPALKKLLAAEGHKVVQKGRKHVVAGFESRLASF